MSFEGLQWWSSGQRARLLLRRYEFESGWGLQFFCKMFLIVRYFTYIFSVMFRIGRYKLAYNVRLHRILLKSTMILLGSNHYLFSWILPFWHNPHFIMCSRHLLVVSFFPLHSVCTFVLSIYLLCRYYIPLYH